MRLRGTQVRSATIINERKFILTRRFALASLRSPLLAVLKPPN